MAEVTKFVGHAVLGIPESNVVVSKFVGHVVLGAPPEAAVGDTLSFTDATWLNNPTSFETEWRRGGFAISGATGETYTLQAADEGELITVARRASNAGGASEWVVSNPVGPIEPA